jgi:hypothetical protein
MQTTRRFTVGETLRYTAFAGNRFSDRNMTIATLFSAGGAANCTQVRYHL